MNSRGGFNTKIGFILAAAGSAVGLGNIWKFPIEVSNGGGAAFLLMYLFFCFILCFPVIVSEIAIGRKSKRNAIGSFEKLGFKKWSFIGKMGVLTGILILSFYSVVAGWVLGYVFEMLRGNFQVYESFYEYTNNVKNIILYSFLFMFVTAFIVSKGIADGIERASKILMPSLIFLMIILILYALTLPNSMEGIKFYLIPDFSQINLNIAFNYGSDSEFLQIIKKIYSEKNINENLNYEYIKKFFYLKNIPEPDLLIRTGGYKRLSNFLLLYLRYTDLFFTDSLWPEFTIKELENFFNEFISINRNYGL